MESEPIRHRVKLAVRILIFGHAIFYALLLLCFALLPQIFIVAHGISYFGDNQISRIPYLIAFFVFGLTLFVGGLALPKKDPFKILRFSLFVLAPIAVGIGISTRLIFPSLGVLHVPFSMSFFVLQFVLAFWLALLINQDRFNKYLLILIFISGIISLLSFKNILPYLLEGQILYQFIFAILLIRSILLFGKNEGEHL